jgi:YHS domain-containing protein
MAKSIRSKQMKKNRNILRETIMGAVVDARTQRLSDRLCTVTGNEKEEHKVAHMQVDKQDQSQKSKGKSYFLCSNDCFINIYFNNSSKARQKRQGKKEQKRPVVGKYGLVLFIKVF